VREIVGDMERILQIDAAWDRRSTDPQKNFGIHGVEMRWILRGPKGATQFLLYTNWQLPEIEPLTIGAGAGSLARPRLAPIPADLGYHSYEPTYEGQTRFGPCDVLTDAPEGCYYDGSGLNADRAFEALLRGGEDGVWEELWSYYQSLFGATRNGGPAT
jgi:hypothetical protein